MIKVKTPAEFVRAKSELITSLVCKRLGKEVDTVEAARYLTNIKRADLDIYNFRSTTLVVFKGVVVDATHITQEIVKVCV